MLQFLLLNHPQNEFECKYFKKGSVKRSVSGRIAWVVSGSVSQVFLALYSVIICKSSGQKLGI